MSAMRCCPQLDPKIWRALGIGALCLAVLFLGLILADALAPADVHCLQMSNEERVDCGRYSRWSCAAAGCCWAPVQPNPGHVPSCFYGDQKMVNCTLGADAKRPFSDEEMSLVMKYFEANLDAEGTGEVVAAPDHDSGAGGSYYYAWARDGALSMGAYLEVNGFALAQEKMDKWITWLEKSQNEPDPNGINILVEPKFLIPEGTAYTGGWCRPQNDAPGLRSITAINYAAKKPAIASRVWELVKQNLDWVAQNYGSNTCDLWEEVRSTDFFWNRYTMRKALIMGSNFAESVGKDAQRAAWYNQSAESITKLLDGHIVDGYVISSTIRQLDSSVLEAFNVGDLLDLFRPLFAEVVKTLVVQSRLFCRSFQVNQHAASTKIPGVLFGRYEGDTYAGGNPWILLTASAATLLYRQALEATKVAPEPEVEAMLGVLLGRSPTAQNLLGAGDALLLLVKKFLTDGVHMPEQIDRNTGALKSAKDLTWNYANVLKAMHARQQAEAALKIVQVEI